MPKQMELLQIADLLERCATEETDARSVLQNLNVVSCRESEAVINDAIHFLNHFVADVDIRSKDKEYDRLQKNQLMQYAETIRALHSK